MKLNINWVFCREKLLLKEVKSSSGCCGGSSSNRQVSLDLINIPFLGVGFICLSLQESIVRCYDLYAILSSKVTFNFRDIKMFPFKFYYPCELKNTVKYR